MIVIYYNMNSPWERGKVKTMKRKFQRRLGTWTRFELKVPIVKVTRWLIVKDVYCPLQVTLKLC